MKRCIKTRCPRLSAMAAACALTLLLAACSSDEEEVPELNAVEDPVTIRVDGLSGALLDNVQNTLAALPAISRKRSFFFARELRDQTGKALHALGYYHPKIEIKLPKRDDESDRELTVKVDPGKPLFIRQSRIEILGEGAYYSSFARIIKESGLATYDILDHGKYEAIKSALRSNAMSLGFFDAKLQSSSIVVYQDLNVADIYLVFDTGRRYEFGELRASDATRELMEPSLGLYDLNQGDKFSSQRISDYQSAMTRTGFYRSVDIHPVVAERHDYQVPLELELERKSHNLMRIGPGFSTDEGPRLLVGWEKPLLNRYGHSLDTYARVSQIKQDAQLIYKIPRKDPNLDYYYLRLAQTHTDFNDTLSDLSHFSVHYVANHTGKWRRDFYLAAEYEDYEQGSEKGHAKNLMPGIKLGRRESSGGFDPHTGYSFSIDLTGGTRMISDDDFVRANLVWKGVLSPTETTRLVYRAQAGGLFGRDSLHVPPSLRFFTGGDQSVRGYGYLDESPLNSGGLKGGRYAFSGTVEFQFPCGIESARIATFLDAGEAVDDPALSRLIYGPGLGFRYMSKYGTVKVDLAYGLQRDSGLRLHFSFGPEF